ncbi:MAG: preprotein translocase subunit SecG [Candidatus Omnitrophota bacterium]
MTGLFIFVHVLVCVMLIVIILMQSGRGGGLTEGFAAAESVFGAKTNEFMIKATAIAGIIFLVTSLTLAHLSSRAERSIMADQEQKMEQEMETLPLLPDDVKSPEAGPIEDMENPSPVTVPEN